MSTSDPAHDYSEEVHAWFADDDEDDVDDDFEDEFGDDDDDDDEDDDEEDSEDPETWQVFGRPTLGRKRRGLRLTSVPERAWTGARFPAHLSWIHSEGFGYAYRHNRSAPD